MTIHNAEGEADNCVMTNGGTFLDSDEETLRQIEAEGKSKLKHKAFKEELFV